MRPSTFRAAPTKWAAWRSGLEERVGHQLASVPDLQWSFETEKITYQVPARTSKYTPDFPLITLGTNKKIYIETKGKFDVKDRQKHLFIQAQHPEVDIRFVFSNSNTRISKQSPTTYAMWCRKHGFLYADKLVPERWLHE